MSGAPDGAALWFTIPGPAALVNAKATIGRSCRVPIQGVGRAGNNAAEGHTVEQELHAAAARGRGCRRELDSTANRAANRRGECYRRRWGQERLEDPKHLNGIAGK